jgi:hypothetical protein
LDELFEDELPANFCSPAVAADCARGATSSRPSRSMAAAAGSAPAVSAATAASKLTLSGLDMKTSVSCERRADPGPWTTPQRAPYSHPCAIACASSDAPNAAPCVRALMNAATARCASSLAGA